MENVNSLKSCWERSPKPSLKVSNYFKVYEEIFGHLVNTKCTFLETGVLDGGSLFMWREWLGPDARIIGIDLNPQAEKWNDHGFEIFIGDQGDPQFWEETFSKIGSFDAFLDDGGHQSFQQIITVQEAIKATKNNCVIAVEDTHSNLYKDFSKHGNYSFLEYSKDATDILLGSSANTRIFKERYPKFKNKDSLNLFKKTYKISFYSGIVAYHIDFNIDESPKLVRNTEDTSAKQKDFRYEVRSSAKVKWPYLFKNKIINVKGGDTIFGMIKKNIYKKRVRPFLRDIYLKYFKK